MAGYLGQLKQRLDVQAQSSAVWTFACGSAIRAEGNHYAWFCRIRSCRLSGGCRYVLAQEQHEPRVVRVLSGACTQPREHILDDESGEACGGRLGGFARVCWTV